jgi:hypothetical protein
MEATTKRSRSKLWIGFALMCFAVLIWIIGVQWVLGSMGSNPAYKPGATAAEMEAALARIGNPMDMMMKMMIGYAISGIVFIGGMVVTGLGMIDYAAEVRARG